MRLEPAARRLLDLAAAAAHVLDVGAGQLAQRPQPRAQRRRLVVLGVAAAEVDARAPPRAAAVCAGLVADARARRRRHERHQRHRRHDGLLLEARRALLAVDAQRHHAALRRELAQRAQRVAVVLGAARREQHVPLRELGKPRRRLQRLGGLVLPLRVRRALAAAHVLRERAVRGHDEDARLLRRRDALRVVGERRREPQPVRDARRRRAVGLVHRVVDRKRPRRHALPRGEACGEARAPRERRVVVQVEGRRQPPRRQCHARGAVGRSDHRLRRREQRRRLDPRGRALGGGLQADVREAKVADALVEVEARARPLVGVAVRLARGLVLELDLVVGAAAEALQVLLEERSRLGGHHLRRRLAAGAARALGKVEDLTTRPRRAEPEGASVAVGSIVGAALAMQVVPASVVGAAEWHGQKAASGGRCLAKFDFACTAICIA